MKRRMPITVFHALSAAHGEVRGISKAGPHEGGHLGTRFWRIAGAAGYTCLLLVALALAPAPPAGAEEVCAPPSGGQQFSDWSAPINLGPIVNSEGTDQGPAISKDELELYFIRLVGVDGVSPDPGDIWVTTRKNKNAPWENPKNLGSTINTLGRESQPALSRDGHLLYFSSDRPGGFGGFDIWVSERIDRHDPFGWQPPVNLGPGINTNGAELGPAPFEDHSTQTFTLYFYRIPAGGVRRDLFSSTLDENGAFTAAVPIAELNTQFDDEQPSIRRDGLEMFFSSNRPGSVVADRTTGLLSSDIWVSTRPSTSEPWSCPVNLGSLINTAGVEQRPALSFDGRSLYFFSNGHGGSGLTDLFVSTRTKLDDFDDGDDDD